MSDQRVLANAIVGLAHAIQELADAQREATTVKIAHIQNEAARRPTNEVTTPALRAPVTLDEDDDAVDPLTDDPPHPTVEEEWGTPRRTVTKEES